MNSEPDVVGNGVPPRLHSTFGMMIKIWIMLSTFALLAGCIAGGIGMYYRSEENYWQDNDYVILLERSAPGGNAAKGFQMAFLLVDGQERTEMKVVDASRETVRFEGRISSTDIQNELTYHFEFTSGGEMRSTPVYEASPRPEPEQGTGGNAF